MSSKEIVVDEAKFLLYNNDNLSAPKFLYAVSAHDEFPSGIMFNTYRLPERSY